MTIIAATRHKSGPTTYLKEYGRFDSWEDADRHLAAEGWRMSEWRRRNDVERRTYTRKRERMELRVDTDPWEGWVAP